MSQGPYQPYNNQQPPYLGQFQPPRYPPRPPYALPPSTYSGWLLFALVMTYLLSILFVLIEIAVGTSVPASADASSSGSGILGSAAVVLLLALHSIISVKDRRNFFTLFGKLQWRGMKTWLKVVLVFAYLSMWIMSGIYLVQATKHFLRTKQQTLGQALQGGWLWYRAKTQTARLIISIGIALLLIGGVTFTTVGAMADHANIVAQLAPTATTSQIAANTDTITPTPTQVSFVAPTATSAPSPTPTLTPKPTPVPTPTPVPVPKCVAVNNNPWCYNFTPGNLIYVPPSGFCGYFTCIPSFNEPDDPGDGYIVECNDTEFSQSGGERGACSHHGGVMTTLYSH